ncbi:MAG: hypothetical protein FJY29_04625 [Betaproteobacteria bacterium]|nr:hypothetical protein [Betaproteobacteria bacterium]
MLCTGLPTRLYQFVAATIVLLMLEGCVYRFGNSERTYSTQPRTLYIAPVADNTSRAGQSARLMAALKRLLAQDRVFILTDKSTARWGVEVQIIASGRAITRVEKCDQGNEILASGAVTCARIKENGQLPDISAEEEIAQISVRARAMDLENGALLFQANFPNLTTGPYPVVGDGSVRSSLSNKQGLHPLRYNENSENAFESLAQIAAQRIYEQLVALPPPAPNY